MSRTPHTSFADNSDSGTETDFIAELNKRTTEALIVFLNTESPHAYKYILSTFGGGESLTDALKIAKDTSLKRLVELGLESDKLPIFSYEKEEIDIQMQAILIEASATLERGHEKPRKSYTLLLDLLVDAHSYFPVNKKCDELCNPSALGGLDNPDSNID